MCGVAEAQTTISPYSEASRPYQRWVELARAPTPQGQFTLIESHCPTVSATACTRPSDQVIWLKPSRFRLLDHLSFLHELGHNAMYTAGEDFASEDLAWSYAYCAFGLGHTRRIGYGFAKPPGTRQLCYRVRRGIPLN